MGGRGGPEIRRQGEEEGVKGLPVPLCLFDKSNRWPLTVKSLPRCRRAKVRRDPALGEEQVLRRGREKPETREREKGDLANVRAFRVAHQEETSTTARTHTHT